MLQLTCRSQACSTDIGWGVIAAAYCLTRLDAAKTASRPATVDCTRVCTCTAAPRAGMLAVDCAARRWQQHLTMTHISREPRLDKTLQNVGAACCRTPLQVPRIPCSPVPSPGSGTQPWAGHGLPVRAASDRRCAAGLSLDAVQQQRPCQQLQGLPVGWPGAWVPQ